MKTNNINRKLLIILCLGFSFSLYSQNCLLQGIISDKDTDENLAFAAIQITGIQNTDFQKSAISNINGSFEISEIPYGNYKTEVSYMGYEKNITEINISHRKEKIKISLKRKAFKMDDIEVSAEKKLVEQSIEKTTINISKNPVLNGANSLDALQSISSVDIDMEGKISYRGSDKVTLLINGRQSELVKSLEQIPADQIEKIEIINNPSAKYDAEGMSGIINIVLKKTKQSSSKTTLMLKSGIPEIFGGNIGYFGFKSKSNFFINAGINHKTKFQTKEHWRTNEFENSSNYYQYDRQDEILNNVFLNCAYDYSINEKQIFGFKLFGSKKFDSADRSINYKTLDKDEETIYNSFKDIEISKNNYSFDTELFYNYDFSKKKQKLELNYKYSILDQSHKLDNVFYPEFTSYNKELQNTNSIQLNKTSEFSIDYSHPLSDSILFETGYKLSIKNLLNDFSSTSYNSINEIWLNDSMLANEFNFLQNINAAYLNINASFNSYKLQFGLRAEFTSKNLNDSLREDYIDLFPSINLSKKLSQNISVFVSFNRRINRPVLKMVNPYTNEYADILNMHIGNPELKPEYVNSYETGLKYRNDFFSIMSSIYFRNIDQAISRVKSASNDSALLVTFMNLNNAKLLGSDISISINASDWWSINSNLNVFYSELSGIYEPNNINRSFTSWTTKIMNSFKLPKKFGIQINGFYKSEFPDVMGTYLSRYYIDFAASKIILWNKAKIVFRISDVFNNYRYGLDLNGIDENGYEYSQKNRRKNESQYFVLSFIYNIDGKEKKKKKTNYFLEDFGK